MNLNVLDPWPIVVIPAFILALIVRIDAKLLGPYFSFSELIPGFGNELLFSQKSTRAALVRRLLYPLAIGLIISSWDSMDVSRSSLVAIGLLGSILLLWPIVFHGLPRGISARSKLIPVLYLSLMISYGGLALSGGYVADIMRNAGDGDIWAYVRESFRDWFITGLVVLFFTSIGRGARVKLDRQMHDH